MQKERLAPKPTPQTGNIKTPPPKNKRKKTQKLSMQQPKRKKQQESCKAPASKRPPHAMPTIRYPSSPLVQCAQNNNDQVQPVPHVVLCVPMCYDLFGSRTTAERKILKSSEVKNPSQPCFRMLTLGLLNSWCRRDGRVCCVSPADHTLLRPEQPARKERKAKP